MLTAGSLATLGVKRRLGISNVVDHARLDDSPAAAGTTDPRPPAPVTGVLIHKASGWWWSPEGDYLSGWGVVFTLGANPFDGGQHGRRGRSFPTGV